VASFGIVPEGLAAAWSAQLTTSPTHRGWFQGAIMMAGAVGFIIGSLVVSRLATPAQRVRLIRPFALLTPLALVPAIFQPGVWVVVAMSVASGITLAGMIPASNGLFVQALPPAFRARAFGVMQSGVHLIQGGAVFVTGWLAAQFPLPHVVGLWGIGGVALMVLLSLTWPSQATINDAVAANRIRIAAEAHAGTTPGGDFGEDTIDLGRPTAPQRRPRPTHSAMPKPSPSAQPGPAAPPNTPAQANSASPNSATRPVAGRHADATGATAAGSLRSDLPGRHADTSDMKTVPITRPVVAPPAEADPDAGSGAASGAGSAPPRSSQY
jgi:hypothetical protein